jgi:uncharacterized heparinase superfamily protein
VIDIKILKKKLERVLNVRIRLYWHTLKYLRARQWIGRLLHFLPKPLPQQSIVAERRAFSGRWTSSGWRSASFIGADAYRFGNKVLPVRNSSDWRRDDLDALWLYNLHYFDDLDAVDSDGRLDLQSEWIERWIESNPMGVGRGWDPYPTSLRIVNWVRWSLRGGRLSDKACTSLALQARWLGGRLETHLLGNHLWSNAKALVFAGTFFLGEEAERWFFKGLNLLEAELAEQCLADGGHFERSPMYHALFLEDVLDLFQLSRLQPGLFPSQWSRVLTETATRMFTWLVDMVHPDGEIAFFNDATKGVSAPLASLRKYGGALEMPFAAWFAESPPRLRHFASSGFVRMESAAATLLCDVGSVGPDYLPGHAHAGTLSFELSVGASRVVVNSGVSLYGESAERQRQRGSRAHSTLVVDGADSSEVWAGFRVARRARVLSADIEGASGKLRFRAVHDGYRRLSGSPIHRRAWTLDDSALVVEDEIIGFGRHHLEILFHLAPGWCAERAGEGLIRLWREGQWTESSANLYVAFERPFEAIVECGSWHPGFGVSERSVSVAFRATLEVPASHSTRISWGVAT